MELSAEHSSRILAITHRVMVKDQPKKGGLDIILDALRADGYWILLVEFQLAGRLGVSRAPGLGGRGFCNVKLISRSGENLLGTALFPHVPEPVRWGLEVITLPGILRRFYSGRLPDLAICADPLCCMAARKLQRKKRIERYHFHCVDFSEARFGMRLLDRIYVSLYRSAVRQAASVDVVSRPMLEKMKEFLGGDAGKLMWMPNVPEMDGYPNVAPDSRMRHTLVCAVSGVEPIYKLDEAVKIVAELSREFPDVKLIVIGNTDVNPKYLEHLRQAAAAKGVEKRIEWKGFMPRDEARRLVSRCSIGLALYDGTVPHVKYIDSLKMREYAASGLPMIGSAVCATAVEAREHGAGHTANDAVEAIAQIKALWSDEKLYEETSAAALKWAYEMAKTNHMIELKKLLKLEGHGSA